MLMADKKTSFLALYPCVEKNAREVQYCLRDFEGPTDYINMVYSDNAPEFVTAVKSQSKLHETSTPHKSETNARIERKHRLVHEGSRTVLEQSGLTKRW